MTSSCVRVESMVSPTLGLLARLGIGEIAHGLFGRNGYNRSGA
jgi:hypothetical protein